MTITSSAFHVLKTKPKEESPYILVTIKSKPFTGISEQNLTGNMVLHTVPGVNRARHKDYFTLMGDRRFTGALIFCFALFQESVLARRKLRNAQGKILF